MIEKRMGIGGTGDPAACTAWNILIPSSLTLQNIKLVEKGEFQPHMAPVLG